MIQDNDLAFRVILLQDHGMVIAYISWDTTCDRRFFINVMGKKRDIIIGGFFLALAVIVYISSFSIKKLVVSRIGSDFVPQLMAIVLAILSIILIIQALTTKTTSPNDTETPSRAHRFSVAATFILIFFYLILLEPVGFLISSAVYLFFQFTVLSPTKINIPLYGLLSISTSVLLYFLFVNAFSLFLPAGILG